MNYLVFHFTDQVTLSKILVYQALDRLKKNQRHIFFSCNDFIDRGIFWGTLGKNKRDITICPPTLCMKPWDQLLLTNRFNIHRCSDYCLTLKSGKNKKCRMEFGSKSSPGKQLREIPAIATVWGTLGKNKRDITICPPTLCMKP
jgi:hypothetical protein